MYLRYPFPLTLLIVTVLSSAGCDKRQHSPQTDSHNQPADRHLVDDYPAITGGGDINVVVEIPAGTNAKWEVEKDTGRLRWETRNGMPRVVDYLAYPANYGMLPQTLLPEDHGGDGDPLDVIVLGTALDRGLVVTARPVALLKLLDDGEQDDKIVAVLPDSPFGHIHDLSQLMQVYPGVTTILETWFSSYKGPGEMESRGWKNASAAKTVIDTAVMAYAASNKK